MIFASRSMTFEKNQLLHFPLYVFEVSGMTFEKKFLCYFHTKHFIQLLRTEMKSDLSNCNRGYEP